jgi:hypothetical protein
MIKAISISMVLVLAIPTAFIATILIHPFWRWFEGVSGIESFGHSGPAEWCFWFDYIAIIVIGIAILLCNGNRKALKTEKKQDTQPAEWS